MEKNEILNSNCYVRCSAAGNPNTPVDALTELAKDSDCYVLRSVAGNPNTPVDALTELAKDSDCDVRYSAAGNPNTPVDALTELAKDSDCDVRYSAAGNPNTPGYIPIKREFIVTSNYVAVKGTNHLWYKHNYPNVAPFYTCGCFCGSRKQLLIRIYSLDNTGNSGERKMILDELDKMFEETFGKK